jgi:hypothetical protein
VGLKRNIEVVAKRVNVVASSDGVGVGVGGFDALDIGWCRMRAGREVWGERSSGRG